MTDRVQRADSDPDGRGAGPDGAPTTGAPRWVKMLGVLALALLVVFLVLQLTGVGGNHGPERHLSFGPGSATPSIVDAGSSAHAL
jgi:hypothetical protein